MLNSLAKGVTVVTTGGLIGTVANVGPNVIELKLNEETKVKVRRSAITEIYVEAAPEANKATPEKDKLTVG
jgi:preprotein translocase subunit YajC